MPPEDDKVAYTPDQVIGAVDAFEEKLINSEKKLANMEKLQGLLAKKLLGEDALKEPEDDSKPPTRAELKKLKEDLPKDVAKTITDLDSQNKSKEYGDTRGAGLRKTVEKLAKEHGHKLSKGLWNEVNAVTKEIMAAHKKAVESKAHPYSDLKTYFDEIDEMVLASIKDNHGWVDEESEDEDVDEDIEYETEDEEDDEDSKPSVKPVRTLSLLGDDASGGEELSDNEVKRLLKAVQSGKYDDDEEFLWGLRDKVKKIRAKMDYQAELKKKRRMLV